MNRTNFIRNPKFFLPIIGLVMLAALWVVFSQGTPGSCYGDDDLVTIGDEGWMKYVNCKSGYSIEYPSLEVAKSVDPSSEGAVEEVTFTDKDDTTLRFRVRVFENAGELDFADWLETFKQKATTVSIEERGDSRLDMKGSYQLKLNYPDRTDSVVAFQKGEYVYFLQFPDDGNENNFIGYSNMTHTFQLK